jgi:hypothetical protein
MSEQQQGALPQPDPALFNPENEVKSAFIKWGKIGDWFEGTLLDVREVESRLPGQEGTMQKIYDFRVRTGYFHEETKVQNADGTTSMSYKQVVLDKGDLWSLGGNKTMDDQMRRIKVGQIFGCRFTEVKPAKTKGFAAQKVRKVYPGKMDPDYNAGTTGASVDTLDEFTKAL